MARRSPLWKKTPLATIDTALSEISAQLGIGSEELRKRTVPAFGLGFVSAKGKPVVSPPTPVRESHPDRVKALRAELTELGRTVSAEHVRLATFLSQGRAREIGPWVRYYLETGTVARRLLWEASADDGRTWQVGMPEADGEHWRLAAHDVRHRPPHASAASHAPR